ncbi:hypothetical protein [Actinoplanes sp. G11-F43]|uniref:hypothetical protein n=1 Tax=Actinoplanes sp. G11-F43 TaxID=3424130 RepID=UPI003D33DD1B
MTGPELPASLDPAAVERLRLSGPAGTPLTRWFPAVAAFVNLRELMLGPIVTRSLVAGVTPGAIPPSVTTLGVFTGGTPVAWPRDVTLPNITGVRADGQLMLRRDAFPNVRAVALKPAHNGQNLDEVLAIPSLRELHLMTVPPAVFSRIGHLPLTGLGLLGGSLTSLTGIESLTGLTSLRLHNLRSLRSIAALSTLPIETLQIRYCPAITDFTPLAELPRLRSLQLVASGTPDLSALPPHVTA